MFLSPFRCIRRHWDADLEALEVSEQDIRQQIQVQCAPFIEEKQQQQQQKEQLEVHTHARHPLRLQGMHWIAQLMVGCSSVRSKS